MSIYKSYSELIKLKSFEERFEYLKLSGKVGAETFGYDRWINQAFYSQPKYKKIRRDVIVRDMGRDLGVEGREINGRVIVHHMNPISIEDIENQSELAWNPEFLICVSHDTHNAIHYGDVSLLPQDYSERTLNDTCPWHR